ncbi:MAG TPA: hypothetical protein VGV40_12580 [Solirubrobacteraceae bacterium]|nr:hypothetical protein [Solirubrobacteraceae bacterium]
MGLRGRPLAAAGAVLAALALVACGENDVPVRVDNAFVARQTLQTFLQVCAEGEGLEALEILNEPAAEVFLEAEGGAAGCERVLQLTPPGEDVGEDVISQVRALERFRQAQIVQLEVTGGLAEARVRAGDEESTVELEDTGERWLLTSASLPLP